MRNRSVGAGREEVGEGQEEGKGAHTVEQVFLWVSVFNLS